MLIYFTIIYNKSRVWTKVYKNQFTIPYTQVQRL